MDAKKLFQQWLLGYLLNSENNDFLNSPIDFEKAKKYKKQSEEIVNFLDRNNIVEWKNELKN